MPGLIPIIGYIKILRTAPKVIYNHKIQDINGRPMLILYQNGKKMTEVPVEDNLRKSVRSAIDNLFHEIQYPIKYTSRGTNSRRNIRGFYFSPKGKEMFVKRQDRYFKEKLRSLKEKVE